MSTAPRRRPSDHDAIAGRVGDRTPPYSIEAEQAVLGSIMLRQGEGLPDVRARIAAEDFFRPDHELAFRLVCDLADRGRAVDSVTLNSELDRRPEFAERGALDFLAEIIQRTANPENISEYVEIVRQKAIDRDLLRMADALIRDVYAGRRPAEDLLRSAEEDLAGIRRGADGAAAGLSLDVRSAASIKVRPVEYLAEPHLPLGMVVLLAGLGGEGKSLLLLDLLARLSTGRPCFGQGAAGCGPIDCLLLANEDGHDDTAVPRLVAAGADLGRVDIIQGLVDATGRRVPFDISHLDYLRRHIEQGRAEGKDYRLVGIDPITTYVGRAKVDDHRDAELKPALEGLSGMSQELGITFACTAHLNKGGGGKAAIHRVMGGSSYVTTARLVYLYGKDPDDEDRRILAPAKCNLPTWPPALAVSVSEVDPAAGREILAPHAAHLSEAQVGKLAGQLRRLAFDGEAETTADELVAGEPRRPGRKDDAIRLLNEILADGKTVPSNDVYARGKAAGISRSAIWEVKSELGVVAKKLGKEWHWSIPVSTPRWDDPATGKPY